METNNEHPQNQAVIHRGWSEIKGYNQKYGMPIISIGEVIQVTY